MKKRFVLFTDIDGTLITSDRRITPRTLQAIRDWTDAGNLFVLSSSRSAPGIEPIVSEYGLKCCVSAVGGALVLDEKRNVIYENGFSVDTGRNVIECIRRNRLDLTWNIFTKDQWLVADRSDPRVIREEGIVKTQSACGGVDDLSPDAAIEKILCMCAPGKIDEYEKILKRNFPKLSIMKSSDLLLEINNEGVSKAVAIEKVCEYFGIDTADTVAFGDNFNDLEMLKRASLGVAMGNAPQEIRDECDRVTDDNNHDGLAIVVEELLSEKRNFLT